MLQSRKAQTDNMRTACETHSTRQMIYNIDSFHLDHCGDPTVAEYVTNHGATFEDYFQSNDQLYDDTLDEELLDSVSILDIQAPSRSAPKPVPMQLHRRPSSRHLHNVTFLPRIERRPSNTSLATSFASR